METSKKDLYGIFEGLLQKYEESETQVNSCLKMLQSEHIGKVDFSEQKRTIKQQMATAQNKFTIATIGMFKAGKSTTLNTLLNLQGETGLSCEFEPDTAKAIRIMKKSENQNFDAEIVYRDGADYKDEEMSWSEAKQYTSQVALNDNPSLKRKAEQISEVRYYIDSDILDSCDFLDLPGLGVNPKHDRVTIEKSNECDAVFWIVSNTEEVNKDTLSQLQLIKHKMIPIINVWYNSDTKKIVGDFSYDEMKDILLNNYKAYIGENTRIMKYCAKAIEMALDKIVDGADKEEAFEDNVDDAWGYDAMQECLHDLVYGEGADLEEEKKERLISNVLDACSDMDQKLDGTISEIKNVNNKLDNQVRSNELIKKKISKAYHSNQIELKEIASNSVDEIIQRINEACELFIDAKMSSLKIGVALKALSQKGKKQLQEDYRREYISKYLEIDNFEKGGTWINSVMNEFKDDLTSIFENEYSKAGLDMDDLEGNLDNKVRLDLKFFDAIGENMSIAFEQICKEFLPTIVAGILLYIPGHQIVDLLLMLGSLTGIKNGSGESKLERRVKETKRRARLSVSFQRVKLTDYFKQLGRSYNESYRNKINEQLNLKNEQIDQLIATTEEIFTIQESLDEYHKQCRGSLLNTDEGV
ncbi:dynamin family protein [Butyrivibrio sp. XBB1001]|uniref:dynamin family protein n=1 Tax=Butyrivibrio sp. XBB1001 TaxID=1280682 RepID=UPI0003F4BBF2|nr:dynamin family protein [Butyrivibrio sp. XBB1001]